MTRYAAIDRHSGYVWGDAIAQDLVGAAEAILRESDGSRERRAVECSRSDTGASLDLYEVPAELVIEDGQRQETIEAVEAGRYVGTVRTIEDGESASWHCQIEGDESATVLAATAQEAARRYVRDSDWSPEEDGWSGTGDLVVWVVPYGVDGRPAIDERESVRVSMRGGRVV